MNFKNINDQDIPNSRNTMYSIDRVFQLLRKTRTKTIHQFAKMLNCWKKLGDDMFDRMNNIKVPSHIKVWCKEINQHGEYS